MGAVAPVATTILPVISAAKFVNDTFGITNRIIGNYDQRKEGKYQRQQQEINEYYARQKEALDLAKNKEEQAATEANRIKNLRHAVAARRASFGSQGVGSSGGSSEAVLLGLFQESEEDRARQENINNIQERISKLEPAKRQAINLLNATQNAEQERLAALYNGVDSIRSLIKF